MHAKSDNIEVMINDEAGEVIEKLFESPKNRYKNNLESMKNGEFFFIKLIYCIINAIK